MNYVLKLCGWYPSKVDALSGDFVQRQAIAISGQCKTVVLFAQKDPTPGRRKIETAFERHGNLFEYVFYYPKTKWLDKLWSQWYYMRVLKSFLPILLKEHGTPSIVHINIVWRAAIWGLYLKKKYNWPFVITEHSTEYQPVAIENIRNKAASRKLITKQAFQSSSLTIPVSNQLGQVIQQLYGPISYRAIPNVVDTSLFYYKPRLATNRPFRLLHISTMGYQKNMEGLIRVLQQLAKSGASFEIIMVGSTDDQVRKMVDEGTVLSSFTTFTGNITYHEVAALMQSADALVLFSRYENLPCVLLEAMCCGLPVITTDVGGIPEIVTKDNGILVPEGNEPALLTALKEVVTGRRPFDQAAIAQKAQALYNYDTVGKSFIDVYQQVLAALKTDMTIPGK